MSDTVMTPRLSPTPVLFAVAIFTSAALVFAVQPMITKMILPQLGGSPAVWNTAMVFFQAALLAGYAYAHGLQRIASLKVQAGVHVGLLALAAVFLPLQVSGALGEPPAGAPILWLLGVLTLSIGLPFAVLSATAPLLQAWFARVHAGEERAENPYVLYAASNLGSFMALLAYPIVVEPTLRLADQTAVWTGGYALFFAMVLALGWLAWRNRPEGGADHAPLTVTPAPSWKTRIAWLLLAAAPSSLMLGVTTHLSTDVASAPFLWVAPLSLYLLTFVVAFQRKPVISRDWGLILHAAAVSALVALLPFNTNEWAILFVMNLGAFFFTALMCHQSLAALRPAPDRLTEFYLWLSLGGVVGGAATALVAPVVFDVVREYPLVLVLAAFARPWGERRKVEWTDWFWLVAVGLLCLVTVAIIALSIGSGRFREFIPFSTAEMLAHGLLAGASLSAFMIRDRILMFVAALAAISVSAHSVAGRYEWTHSERSFFGVMRVATFDDPRLGEVKMLLHGTTLHGAQITREVNQCVPMLYYAVRTPIGQAMLRTQARHREARLGVVGLGTGALGAFVRPTDRMTYYEIDPAVERLARDPKHFTFLSKCAEGPVDVVIGDARLSLAKTPSDTYDLLVVDAFTSDSVPTHLLTVEAVREYLRVIKPDGVVILHLSNRNLEITTPAAATAKAAGGVALHQIYIQGEETSDLEEASTEALLITRSEEAARIWANDPRWTRPPVSEAGPWTDDYTNLVGALVRDIRSR